MGINFCKKGRKISLFVGSLKILYLNMYFSNNKKIHILLKIETKKN